MRELSVKRFSLDRVEFKLEREFDNKEIFKENFFLELVKSGRCN